MPCVMRMAWKNMQSIMAWRLHGGNSQDGHGYGQDLGRSGDDDRGRWQPWQI